MDSQATWSELIAGWELFRDPIVSAGVAGAVLGFLSVYIVLRRMIFVSAVVTQGAGLGLALAFYAGIHWGLEIAPGYCAVALSLAIAGLLAADPGRIGLSREALLGFMFALTGGATILVGSRITQEAHDIQAILFGTAVLVTPDDLRIIELTSAALMILQLWWFRGITFASFDPTAARVQGLPVRLLDGALLLSIGVMVGVSARALGSLPVFAMSTLPAIAAVLFTRGRLGVTFAVAAVLGTIAGVGGYLLAFFEDLPVGSAQTITAAAVVAGALLIRLATHALARILGAAGSRAS